MSQASMFIPPDPQFFDNNGLPLAGGVLYFYQAGTTTPLAVYADSAGTTSLGSQVTLDSAGRAKIWLVGYYKVILKDSLGNQIWTEDNVSSAFSPAATSPVTFNQWTALTDVLTYMSGTQFSVPGDQTTAYLVGSRIRANVTAGIITGTITSAAAGGGPIKTTVTVQWDLAYALDAGLSAVSVGIISAIASSMPIQIPVGGIIDWYKSMAGVPALSWGWVQCDGQTLSDPLSPLNGQVIPNLNGAAAGADTFSNGKVGVFLRGANTSGSYTADAIKAHNHGTSAITINSHTHSIAPGGSSTATATNAAHSHTTSYIKAQHSTSTGGGNVNLWQDGTDDRQTLTTDSQTPAITLAGHTDNNTSAGVTGSVDNNGAATETLPKTVTAVKIMRVK